MSTTVPISEDCSNVNNETSHLPHHCSSVVVVQPANHYGQSLSSDFSAFGSSASASYSTTTNTNNITDINNINNINNNTIEDILLSYDFKEHDEENGVISTDPYNDMEIYSYHNLIDLMDCVSSHMIIFWPVFYYDLWRILLNTVFQMNEERTELLLRELSVLATYSDVKSITIYLFYLYRMRTRQLSSEMRETLSVNNDHSSID